MHFLKFIFGVKLHMFRTVPLFIIRSISLYTQQWYMSYRFADSLRAGSGTGMKYYALILQTQLKNVLTTRAYQIYTDRNVTVAKFPTHQTADDAITHESRFSSES